MQLYAAHIIMYVKLKDEKQQKYPVWENVVVISAQNPEEARIKASQIGKEGEGDSLGSFTWDKKPATWIFAGIRKLIECELPLSQERDRLTENCLNDGIEITYSQLEIENEEALSKLINGEPVTVLYEE